MYLWPEIFVFVLITAFGLGLSYIFMCIWLLEGVHEFSRAVSYCTLAPLSCSYF